jgi:hypothetical protein
MQPPILTKHAQERMTEMKVTYEEVFRAVEHPDIDYRAPRRHGGDTGARVSVRDRICVCYRPSESDPKRLLVMTVLWNREEGR